MYSTSSWQIQNGFSSRVGVVDTPRRLYLLAALLFRCNNVMNIIFVCFWMSNHPSINFYYFFYILSIASKDISAFRGWWARENWERRPERVFINTRRSKNFSLEKILENETMSNWTSTRTPVAHNVNHPTTQYYMKIKCQIENQNVQVLRHHWCNSRPN